MKRHVDAHDAKVAPANAPFTRSVRHCGSLRTPTGPQASCALSKTPLSILMTIEKTERMLAFSPSSLTLLTKNKGLISFSIQGGAIVGYKSIGQSPLAEVKSMAASATGTVYLCGPRDVGKKEAVVAIEPNGKKTFLANYPGDSLIGIGTASSAAAVDTKEATPGHDVFVSVYQAEQVITYAFEADASKKGVERQAVPVLYSQPSPNIRDRVVLTPNTFAELVCTGQDCNVDITRTKRWGDANLSQEPVMSWATTMPKSANGYRMMSVGRNIIAMIGSDSMRVFSAKGDLLMEKTGWGACAAIIGMRVCGDRLIVVLRRKDSCAQIESYRIVLRR